MRINNNIMAINTHRQYSINNNNIAKSSEKLSSGYRINRAGDDAAGLAISEKMRAQIRGLSMASKNSNDAISLVQTTEGALQEVHNILQRMRELAVQAASDTNDKAVDRAAIDLEVQQLKEEIDSIAQVTTFNGIKVLQPASGLASNNYVIQTGANAGDTLNLQIYGLSVSNVGSPIINSQPQLPSYVPVKPADIDYKTISGDSSGAINVNTAADLAKLLNAYKSLNGSDADVAASWSALEAAIGMDQVDFNALMTSSATDYGAATTPTMTFDDLVNALFDEATAKLETQYMDAAVAYGQEMVNYAASVAKVAEYYDGSTGTQASGIQTAITTLAGVATTFTTTADAKTYIDTNVAALKTAVDTFIGNLNAGSHDIASDSDAKVAKSVNLAGVTVTTRDNAQAAITTVNDAVNALSMQRAQLGAYQNRLEHKIANLDTSAENLQAAESRIRDVDMAQEMTTYTRNNILSQAATAMLAQANSAPQNVLQLLR